MKNICAVAFVCLSVVAVAQRNQSVRDHVSSSSRAELGKTGVVTASNGKEKFFRKAKKGDDPVFKTEIDPTQIDIVRDRYGVPHIFAKTDREVAYGLAWAHAEDDFSTIQKTILASKSMLGLYTGREGATVDYIVHLLRIRDLVESRYANDISDDFKRVLQGYCDGVNAYALNHPKEVVVKRAFPVTPQDLLSYSVLQLAMGCDVESTLKKIYAGTTGDAPGMQNDLGPEGAEGSNAFAFNSKKTADGNTFLTINTHHPLEGIVAWYETHLSSEEGMNMLGTTFPGAPVLFIGVNENLGWTHTVNHPDKIDVYQLEINPENPSQYKFDGQWLDLEESVVKLKVKVPGFNLHIKKKAYWSAYGPTVITDNGVFSIRTGGIMEIRALEQWYRMGKATSFASFHKALKMEAITAYNIVYADRYDTIFYLSNGKLPLRDPAYNWKETLPGNTSKTLWKDFHSLDDLAQVLNPRSGYVFNANHSPFKATAVEDNLKAENYDSTIGYETHDNNRSLRVYELLENSKTVSYEGMKRIKYDLQLPKTLAFPVNIDNLFLIEESAHADIADAVSLLKHWNRRGDVNNIGAALFAVCFYDLAEKYKKDETIKMLSMNEAVQTVRDAKEYLLHHFGRIDITLGEYQRLERGDASLPLAGLPDVLASMYSTPTDNGRVKGTLGDCYIGFVKFTPAGPEIETVNAFGASNRKDSPHYDDQMDLFLNQRTKRMSLKRDEVYRSAKSVYHPESVNRILSTKLVLPEHDLRK